jgi:hypothetical protein
MTDMRAFQARLDLAVRKSRAASVELEAAIKDADDVTSRLRLAVSDLKAQQQRMEKR